jgi:predicted Zn finger-like uncharacterized protein
MIVTCTSCSKRYLVDSRALGVAGRNVRCASCGHTWFQAAPQDAAQAMALAAPPEPPSFVVEAERRERRVQLPAVKRSSGRGQFLGLGVAVVVLAGVAWGLIAARVEIMTFWPPAAKLYAMVGYGPTVAGTGLELRKVTPSRGVENGVPILAIDGEVVNISPIVREVPKLKVALRDGNDRELQAWTVAVTEQRLLPGATVPFHTTITQPSDAATGVVVSFAAPGN